MLSAVHCEAHPQGRRQRNARDWLTTIGGFGRDSQILSTLWMIGLLSVGRPVLAQDIPSGFNVARYSSIWERNPFTMTTSVILEKRPSPFDHLFLVSWLKDGEKDVVLVGNSETNALQTLTVVRNQNDLRLVVVHPNWNPQLAEAVVSDGKEQSILRFRSADSPGNEQPISDSSAPVEPGRVPERPIYPGIARVHSEGGPSSVAKVRDKHAQRGSAVPQPMPGQN